jgi:hypothetical protein
VLAGLPEALKHHIEALMAVEHRVVESHERAVAEVDRVGEHERMELEETMRRLVCSLHGGLMHKRRASSRGRIDSARTMRGYMRFDGNPFSPVTVRRAEDKPRLVILANVSLSVRATARFTLHLVHGLQNLLGQVRTFAFIPISSRSLTCSRTIPPSRRSAWSSAVPATAACSTSTPTLTLTPTPTTAPPSASSVRTSASRSTAARR